MEGSITLLCAQPAGIQEEEEAEEEQEEEQQQQEQEEEAAAEPAAAEPAEEEQEEEESWAGNGTGILPAVRSRSVDLNGLLPSLP